MRKKILPDKFVAIFKCDTELTGPLKAVVLLGTLKPSPKLSNTFVLSEFLARHLKEHDVSAEIIRLADYKILSGTSNDEGHGDQWPKILKKILATDIII